MRTHHLTRTAWPSRGMDVFACPSPPVDLQIPALARRADNPTGQLICACRFMRCVGRAANHQLDGPPQPSSATAGPAFLYDPRKALCRLAPITSPAAMLGEIVGLVILGAVALYERLAGRPW